MPAGADLGAGKGADAGASVGGGQPGFGALEQVLIPDRVGDDFTQVEKGGDREVENQSR